MQTKDLPSEAPPAVPLARTARHAGRRWYATPLVVIGAVTLLAGGLRLYQLSTPRQFVFDEVYYAKDGCFDAGIDYRDCQLDAAREQTVTVHPPLGRWIIAGSVALFSEPEDFHCAPDAEDTRTCDPFGFRFASALMGTLSVMLVAILAYRLFGSVLWAGVAGLLLAVENLNFVQSRISMVDIFVATFVVAGFLFLVLDRRWIERRTPPPEELTPEEEAEAVLLGLPPDRPPSPIFRPWRLAAGIAFGAAVASKWSGVTALLAAILLAYAWERSRRADVGLPAPLREAVRDESFGIVLFLVVVPLAVYLASYLEWLARNDWSLAAWWELHRGMASFSIELRSPHPYASRPWTWPLMIRPVAYYFDQTGPEGARLSAEILGMGNPAIFWGGIPALLYTLLAWVRRKDSRAGLIFTVFAVQYFAWFLAQRTSFFFYMTPITPFIVLAGVYALRDLAGVRMGAERSRVLAPLAAFAVAVAVLVFVFFLPVLTGRPIPYPDWRLRMWFPSWI